MTSYHIRKKIRKWPVEEIRSHHLKLILVFPATHRPDIRYGNDLAIDPKIPMLNLPGPVFKDLLEWRDHGDEIKSST